VPKQRFNRPQSSSAPLAVKVGGVTHRGHYSTGDGTIRVTYGSSRKSTQLGGMSNAPWALARIMLAQQAREAFCLVGLVEH
jgi:hypothetical protein